MKDLTKGSVAGHILQFSTFIALSTLFQTLYFLADLYFVGRLGKEAIAGVGLAGKVYDIIRPFGAAAQAGFGIGVRVMQSLCGVEPQRAFELHACCGGLAGCSERTPEAERG